MKETLEGCLVKLLLLFALMGGAGLGGWYGGRWLLARWYAPALTEKAPPTSTIEENLKAKNEIRARRLNLGISPQLLAALVRESLGFETGVNPGGPSPSPIDDATWNQRANEWLDLLASLSPETRQQLENQALISPQHWVSRVNQLRLSSRSLRDLVQVQWSFYLPQVALGDGEPGPLGLVWQAVTADVVARLEAGTAYEKLSFNPGENQLTTTGQLAPGQGRAFVIALEAQPALALTLSAPAGGRLSFYSPTGQAVLLENSAQYQWSGALPETGYYELVITNPQGKNLDYQLELDRP
jgi:serine/threonine-protein kinase